MDRRNPWTEKMSYDPHNTHPKWTNKLCCPRQTQAEDNRVAPMSIQNEGRETCLPPTAPPSHGATHTSEPIGPRQGPTQCVTKGPSQTVGSSGLLSGTAGGYWKGNVCFLCQSVYRVNSGQIKYLNVNKQFSEKNLNVDL